MTNGLSYSMEKLLKTSVPGINSLALSSKSNLLCTLFCDRRPGPYKHFSFAKWLNVKFCQSAAGTAPKGGVLFLLVLVCSCLLALVACSTQQHEGHSTALTLQQDSAECLWVALQKILLVPLLAPQ